MTLAGLARAGGLKMAYADILKRRQDGLQPMPLIMNGELPKISFSPAAPVPAAGVGPYLPSWSERYGERHRLVRVAEFPAGIVGPKQVRVYARRDHYVLQWWDS